ncbi:condensation domain protein, partial [Mycobacterium xenopi 4042]
MSRVAGGVDPHRSRSAPAGVDNHHIVLDGWSLPILLGRF